MRVIIEADYQSLSQWAANYVVSKINKANPTTEKPFVLGLPTGSSPLGMYKALIQATKTEKFLPKTLLLLIWTNMLACQNLILKATILSCSTTSSIISTSTRTTFTS